MKRLRLLLLFAPLPADLLTCVAQNILPPATKSCDPHKDGQRSECERQTTLIDNAVVIQIFGARNLRMAQDLANIIGGLSAEQIMGMGPDERMLLIKGELPRAKQTGYYNDRHFNAGSV